MLLSPIPDNSRICGDFGVLRWELDPLRLLHGSYDIPCTYDDFTFDINAVNFAIPLEFNSCRPERLTVWSGFLLDPMHSCSAQNSEIRFVFIGLVVFLK